MTGYRYASSSVAWPIDSWMTSHTLLGSMTRSFLGGMLMSKDAISAVLDNILTGDYRGQRTVHRPAKMCRAWPNPDNGAASR